MRTRLVSLIVASLVVATAISGCISDKDDHETPPGPSILEGLTPARGDVATVLDTVGDPRVAAALVVIAELFNMTFPDQAALIAKRAGDNGTTTSRVAIYIWGDPHVRENLFTEVLFHSPNAGDAIAAALNGRTLTQSSLSSQPGLAAAMLAYGPTYNGRNPTWAMLTGIEGGGETTGASSNWQVCGFLHTSPLVLDMDGDGLLTASGGLWLPHPTSWSADIRPFDIDVDGYEELIEWVGPNDGLLTTRSPTATGPMTGADLFGDTDGSVDGFTKLAQHDKDGDGRIKGGELDGLSVWKDANGDAVAGTGEVRSLKELRITDIGLGHRQLRSSFVMDGKERLMWDWYPNALEAMRAPADGGGAAPTLPTVVIGGLSRTAREAASGMASGEGHSMTPQQLALNGLSGAELVTVLDTGVAVLLGKWSDPLWLEPAPALTLHLVGVDAGGVAAVKHIRINASEVLAVVPTPNMKALLVVADGGSRLLEVELKNATVYTLVESPIDAGKAGFRFGGALSILDGRVFSWGTFHDADGRIVTEAVASFPWEGGCLTLHHDLRALFKTAGISPIIGSVASNSSLMFASYDKEVSLWEPVEGGLRRVDGGPAFRGMWASTRGTLYLVKRPQADGVEAVVYRPGAEPMSLGTGDYHYPVMSAHGRAIVVATYDIANMTMDYRVAHTGTKWAITPLLDDVPIGPLRLSDEGLYYAYLSSQGLAVGPLG